MRLLKRQHDGEFVPYEFNDESTPPYAILSHTWFGDHEEVTFQDIKHSTGRSKRGWKKITFCAEKAISDGLEYFWIDTCCINQKSSSELSEALNSMFRWYRNSRHCYVYLSDVSFKNPNDLQQTLEADFRQSRWFTRGWTLQELLAPSSVKFFSEEANLIGDKKTLVQPIHEITRIPVTALSGTPLAEFTTGTRMKWASNRQTKRAEDKAYCLFGILNVHMCPIYGEGGEEAWDRLKEVVEKKKREVMEKEKKDYADFLKSLSYPEMDYRCSNVSEVEDGTCSWLLNHSHYQRWQSDTESSPVLIICGKPGSGKSTAMKRAYEIARQRAQIHKDQVVSAFFFNSRGTPMEKNPEGFFRSVLHQLLKNQSSFSDDAFALWQQKNSSIKPGWVWEVNELKNMLKDYISRSISKITIFLDALDECESATGAQDLVKYLTSLRQCHGSGPSRPRICISKRHYPNLGANELHKIKVEETNEMDIERYVHENLQGPAANFADGLSSKITSRSRGIFLWAHLVLEKIKTAINDGEPLTKLYAMVDRTPERIEELFQELMDSVPADEREERDLIITWILFARCTLQLSELNHALAFKVEHPSCVRYERSQDFIPLEQRKKLLTKYTRGLVEAVERNEDFHVQFIHESVREYLLSPQAVIQSGTGVIWSDPGLANDALARSCFNYIKAVCADAECVHGSVPKISGANQFLLDYGVINYFSLAEEAEKNGIAPQYLFDWSANDAPDGVSWWTFVSILEPYQYQKFRYLWDEMKISDRNQWSSYAASQLTFACGSWLNFWVEDLLQSNKLTFSTLDLSIALCAAARSGDTKWVSTLIRMGADVNYEDSRFGCPLTMSMVLGGDNMIEVLLAHGATTYLESLPWSILVLAIRNGSIKTLKSLLARGARLAECHTPDVQMLSLGTHALEASVRMEIYFLEELLPYSESQRLSVEYYKTAYLLAIALQKFQHAESLKSEVTRLFPGHWTTSISIVSRSGERYSMEIWTDTDILSIRRMIGLRQARAYPEYEFWKDLRLLKDDQTICDMDNRHELTFYEEKETPFTSIYHVSHVKIEEEEET